MTSSLEGRTAIVTGGSTLVGHGVVQALHEAGARVVVADVDTEGGARCTGRALSVAGRSSRA